LEIVDWIGRVAKSKFKLSSADTVVYLIITSLKLFSPSISEISMKQSGIFFNKVIKFIEIPKTIIIGIQIGEEELEYFFLTDQLIFISINIIKGALNAVLLILVPGLSMIEVPLFDTILAFIKQWYLDHGKTWD
jgi:hypothetical protein